MKRNFTQSFKIQAVEKALNRSDDTTLTEIANALSIGCSTLSKWIVKARNNELEIASSDEINRMKQDKRPQDWTQEERLNMVITCSTLDDEALSEYCRQQGVYLHHIKQWKLDFINGQATKSSQTEKAEVKKLKHENKALKKELNRKDKALAETAALLVLKKKVDTIWGIDEDS
jgi:transposase-like protein